ncbi:hypothetical protein D3C84_769140 [compost metagenome]
MDILFLLIDMPEQRPTRPLRTDEGIFAAHGVEITAPQQLVILVLTDKRQHLHGHGFAHVQRAGLQIVHAQPALDIAEHPPLGHQHMSGRRIAGQRIQPTGQPGVFVGKQRNQLRIRRSIDPQALQECSLSLWILLKLPTPFQQAAFTQQAARTFLEPRKEEELLHVPVFHRWQTMATHHPVLGTQVIKIHPQRRLLALGHRLHIGSGQLAGECGDHHIRGLGRQPLGRPLTDLDTLLPLLRDMDIDLGAHALESTQVIDP